MVQTEPDVGNDTRPLGQSDVVTGGRTVVGAGLERGRTVGRYVVVDRLGAGGMGVVYRAFDPDLDRSIALKLVAIAVSDRADDERTRLLREAQAMARLAHPNVIPVFDVGVADGLVFVAMELVDGITLARWCERERGVAEILAVFAQAGAGLAAAHRAGLVHRDFKPDNVMLGNDGRVRVLDFGLARSAGGRTREEHEATAEIRSNSGRSSSLGHSLDQALTVDGAVMGTPRYMSPEQHLGVVAGAASDQFSFCVALWEALYGERPFAGDTFAALSLNVLQGKLREPPSQSRVPAHVHAAMVRGLASDDTARHPSMDALLVALAKDPSAARRRVIALVGGGALVLGTGAWIGSAMERDDEVAVASPCTGAAELIADTWNDERRAQLEAAFADTRQAYAPAVWTNAAPMIDAWVEDWVAARTDACAATRIAGDQSEALMDLRIACLDRSQRELDALLHALHDPNEIAVERAIDAVRRLPELERCADAAWLADPTPLPDDPDARQAIADAMVRLDEVGAMVALGRYAHARLLLGPVLLLAEQLDHPPLSAAAAAYDGEIFGDTGGAMPARRAWERGFAEATTANDASLQTELTIHLAHQVGFVQADREGGESWLRIGRAIVRRQGGDAWRTAQLDATEGAILVGAGQYEQGIAAHQRALARMVERDPDGLSVARLLDDIGAAQVQLGRVDEAVANHLRAIEIRIRVYGPDHPVVATSERELGVSLSLAGRIDEAKPPLERALAIQRAARGEVNVPVATILDDLGRIARSKGELDVALQRHREALAIWEKVLGDPHPDLAVSLLNVGYTLVAAGKGAEAVDVDRRALAMFEKSVGAKHPYIVYAGNALGAALLSAGRPDEAIAPLEHALALQGKIEVDPTLFA
ncbi:MAG TPA: serine/threonine-protein kinase, partial [Nannocystaceae bacterium]|nr:serine/threonine-protein kinase [Nannocystaceae bacterium]